MTWPAGGPAMQRQPEMNNSQPPRPEDVRQRKLDELFGDEPFLSPTMKARRLHEKSAEQPVGSGAIPLSSAPMPRRLDLVPEVSEEEATALWQRRTDVDKGNEQSEFDGGATRHVAEIGPRTVKLKIVETRPAEVIATHTLVSRAEAAANPARMPIPLAAAAAYLRSECQSGTTPPGMETLKHFRTDVLLRWLKHVPTRGIDGVPEEF